jgi:hypothetical protein
MGRPMATSQDFVNWVCGERLRSMYLHYMLIAEQESIRRFAVGSVHPTVYYPEAKAFHICIPGIAQQDAILAILCALDDKIAINDRISETSRRLAISSGQRLFLGESRAQVYLGDYSEIVKGLSYRSADLGTGTYGLVSLKCVGRDGDFQPGGVKLFGGEYKSAQVVDEGDVVVAQTDLTQRVEVIGRPVRVLNLGGFSKLVASLDLVIVRPLPPLSREIILALLSTEEFREHALSYCNGTTVVHLSSKALPEFKFYMPKPDAVRSVTTEMVPLLARSDQARRENQTLAELRDTLLPMAALVTPNLPEAEVLAGFPVRGEADMRRAAERLAALGAKAVLMKGGHLAGERIVDLLFHDGRFDRFEEARIQSRSTHGTGCTLASATAAGLAQKMSLLDAVARAEAAQV